MGFIALYTVIKVLGEGHKRKSADDNGNTEEKIEHTG